MTNEGCNRDGAMDGSGITLLIGGDTCPARGYEPPFLTLPASKLFGEFFHVIREADFALVNLECPLSSSGNPLSKTGSHLRASPDCIRVLSEAGVDACNLSNNHIMDYGPEGLRDTVDTCAGAGIRVVGAGGDLPSASRPLVFRKAGIRAGVIACAENEWSIAAAGRPGANPFRMPETLQQIRSLRSEVDFLLVLFHGGREHFPLPYPGLRRWCRHMISEGADAVICQHSHCVGGWERCEHGIIGYGQGNLFFDRSSQGTAAWHEGLLIRFRIAGRGVWNHERLPYIQSKDIPGLRRMSAAENDRLDSRMAGWAEVLGSDQALEEAWRTHCRGHASTYISILMGGGRPARWLLRRFPFLQRWYRGRRARFVLNALRCETHYAILRTILEDALERDDSK